MGLPLHKHPDLGIITEGELIESVESRFENADKVIKVRGFNDLPERKTPVEEQKPIIKSLPPPQFKRKAVETSDTIWQAFVDEWETACWYCGTEKAPDRRELHLDHIEPNKGDGTNDDCFNRALACAPCNSDKGNNLDVRATIDKAFADGRIQTEARRNEIERGFRERHEWAKIRWTYIKPNKLPI
ncbi:MAG: HNH endonuclease [Chloroflexi bacterium]|nr:HNH endonuclease [Chloroflexota bacterium]